MPEGRKIEGKKIYKQILFASLIIAVSCPISTLGQQPKPINRLAKESSPYLLQHAHNPVDWYSWGDEAIERAKREHKLIFLSVGYAACHWCHVMERESFMDEEIARFLNDNYVCIKVDREERPDVDQVYMTAAQIMTGSGGWPLSVFLTPDTKPIFGGTYFPARDGDREGQPGFLTVVRRANELWHMQEAGLLKQADAVTKAIREVMASNDLQFSELEADGQNRLGRSLADAAAENLKEQFDERHGGFGYSENQPTRPKFPEPSNLLFLLERSQRDSIPKQQREAAIVIVTRTLDAMSAGGIYDHLGGGFHRYSTDRYWKIPHFEKMLYDNGQLASVYARAYESTGRDEYRSIAEGICDFVLRELTAPSGAFYASLDADSEGEEGKYYRWTAEELLDAGKQIHGHEEFFEIYGLSKEPNFDEKYFIPQTVKSLTSIAVQRGETFALLNRRWSDARRSLLANRSVRSRPITDIKVLTAWNGLMIAGLADAGRIFNRPDYLASAERAANFALKELRTDQSRLFRTFAGGEAKLNGYLDDYAFLTYGLLKLHRATHLQRWVDAALELTHVQMKFFSDPETGGYFYTSSDHPELIVRLKDPVDGALPSGNSVTAANLFYLRFTGSRTELDEPLKKLLESAIPLLKKSPAASPMMSAQIENWIDRLDR